MRRVTFADVARLNWLTCLLPVLYRINRPRSGGAAIRSYLMTAVLGGPGFEIVTNRLSVGGGWPVELRAQALDDPGAGQLPGGLQQQLGQAVAEGVQFALSRLLREDGLPAYLGQALQDQVTRTNDQWRVDSGGWGPPASAACQATWCDGLQALSDELANDIVQSVRQQLQTDGSSAGASNPARPSGTSWMQAIARAMGQVLGSKASRMVELSRQMQDLSGRSQTSVGTAANPLDDASRSQQLLDAAESQRLNTEFQATGQEFNLLQTTFSTAMKTLGEGMASIARRQ
jgi:hypothetical protein